MFLNAQVNRVSEVVTSLADPSANVIFGAVIEDAYEGEVHVTIIATGFTQSFEDAILSGKTPVRVCDASFFICHTECAPTLKGCMVGTLQGL